VLQLTRQQWIYLFLLFIIADFLAFAGLAYYFTTTDPLVMAGIPTPTPTRPIPTVTMTPTPWPGPGPTVTPTATWPPTPIATAILGEAGYPLGFTPTASPPQAEGGFSVSFRSFANTVRKVIMMGKVGKVPIIDQTIYPESFFPKGGNNACGPVALYAAMKGLGADIVYADVRNIAVNNEFGSEGITVSGLVNTAIILNNELGYPLKIQQSRSYKLSDLVRFLNQKSVVIVLVRVKKVDGDYFITTDRNGSFGHYLVIQNINMVTRQVRLAGSTLGMQNVSLDDLLGSWASQPPEPRPDRPKVTFNFLDMPKPQILNPKLKDSKTPSLWALILQRKLE